MPVKMEGETMKRCYLTVGDAARVLGVSPAAVRLMTQRGELETTAETEGGVRLFARPDVERVRRQREQRKAARLES